MSEVHFYLKEPKAKRSLILLRYYNSGDPVKFSTRQTIETANWNSKRERLKSNSATTIDGKYLINDLLDALVKVLEISKNTELKNGIPTARVLREKLYNFLCYNIMEEEKKSNNPTLLELADQFINGDISYRGKQKSPKSLQNYRSAKIHLLEFSKSEKYPITYDAVNLNMFDRLTSFLFKKKGLAHNTVAKTVAVLKTFMNYANESGYTQNRSHANRKFSMPEKETDAVYLSIDELVKLFQFDFSNNKRLEQVRDLFIVGALTGLRFSDFSRIKKENFVTIGARLFLKMQTAKTDQLVIIPTNAVILTIMDKYSLFPNSLPPSISNQKFNSYIKEVCKIAGMNQKGRLQSAPEKELWSLITSHTCRRSMCTNLHIAGCTSNTIMAISGHKSERSFLKYIKISKVDTAIKIQELLDDSVSKFFLQAVM